MLFAIEIFGVLIAAMCLIGLVQPAVTLTMVRGTASSAYGWPAAVGLRVILGSLLIAAAAQTPVPEAVAAIGVVTLLAAATLVLMGEARFSRFVDKVTLQPAGIMRLAFVFGLAFGGFLIYAAHG